MKFNRIYRLTAGNILLSAVLVFTTLVGYFYHDRRVFFVQLVVCVAAVGWVIWRQLRYHRDIRRYFRLLVERLNEKDRETLLGFPIPTLAVTLQGEIVWYTPSFEQEILKGSNAYGKPLEDLTGGRPVSFFAKSAVQLIPMESRWYKIYSHPIQTDETPLILLHYVDDTEHQATMEEYTQSRPVVMALYIDNIEELMQNTRDSERAHIIGRVETLLEDWVSAQKGIMRRYSSERFLVIVEQRHMDVLIREKFPILDKVRSIETTGGTNITLSIGVGSGDTLLQGEEQARKSLEMALGRGGDQAAVKTGNGYDFFGGVSKGVERRTRVRTRVVASALVDLINESQQVLVMGHRYSDLDCLGAGAGLVSAVRALGKPAWVVTDPEQTLAPELLARYVSQGKSDVFLTPEEAIDRMTPYTLLMITDCHNPVMLESTALYQQAKTVVVIDHHRKMVNHVDNAVIFYHEPNASSASEMVTELTQYMGENNLSRVDAEALLAGIMLDTRSFVMKAGVRTFEAAAYLRRLGADTVEVKRLFAAGMEVYRLKAALVASAEIFGNAVIAYTTEKGGKDTRIAASQAADELLSIKGAEAAFTLFPDKDGVNISARSLGKCNVQLVMEALGGGGHMTMAGAFLKNVTVQESIIQLKQAIQAYQK